VGEREWGMVEEEEGRERNRVNSERRKKAGNSNCFSLPRDWQWDRKARECSTSIAPEVGESELR